jgi:hypothetical protein
MFAEYAQIKVERISFASDSRVLSSPFFALVSPLPRALSQLHNHRQEIATIRIAP